MTVREISVTLITEPTASACGCTAPKLAWSNVFGYGRSVRRVYFYCVACHSFGFLALPAENWDVATLATEQSPAGLAKAIDRNFEALPDNQEIVGIFERAADDVFTRRAPCAELHLESIGKSVVDEALAVLTRRAEERLREHDRRMADEERRAMDLRFGLEEELRRAKRTRRQAVAKTLERRKPVSRSEFRVIARGSDHSGAVIYGLIDPRQPELIRYVGQARSAGARLGAHIAGSTSATSKKDRWVAQLASEGVFPDMALLERAKPGVDVDVLERWWIAQMVAKGQADMNTASVPKPANTEKAGAQ